MRHLIVSNRVPASDPKGGFLSPYTKFKKNGANSRTAQARRKMDFSGIQIAKIAGMEKFATDLKSSQIEEKSTEPT